MHQYLDDWLMKNQLKSLVERHRDLTLFWVNKLGFLVNEGKSQLIPTQAPAFLAKLRLKELPLTKGTLFAGEWTTTVESTTKAQLLSVTQAQLARDQPGAG